MAPGKRKRGDRGYSHDGQLDGSRPSPHRPGNTALAQQSREQEQRWRGGPNRRASRGGRGGGNISPGFGPGQPGAHTASPNAASNATKRDANAVQGMESQPAGNDEAATLPTRDAATTSQVASRRDETSAPPKTSQHLPLTPYLFEHLTESRMANWSEAARKEIIDVGLQAARTGDSASLGALFQEIIQAALRGKLKSDEAGLVVKDVVSPESETDTIDSDQSISETNRQLLLLDSLSILTEYDPSNAALPGLVLNTQIPAALMRLHLDTTLLEALGLVRNTFNRMTIRKTTNLLYRQANFNLLREETEGYSKLITELFTTSNNQPPTSEVVEETFERVRALIGAFDLDVGRVLDVVLDVFASVLVKQYRFFVKLLRASSWWPHESDVSGDDASSALKTFETLPHWAFPASNFQLDEEEQKGVSEARQERDRRLWDQVNERGMAAFFDYGYARQSDAEQLVNGSEGDDLGQQWSKVSGCPNPRGNRVAAQLLGFKLRFYSSSSRSHGDVLPMNLIYLAALLIKVGFISLKDLYPHLWPLDEDMEKLKAQKLKEKEEKERASKPGGTTNALMTAGALSDDTLPGPMARLREGDGNRMSPARKIDETAEKTPGTPGDEKDVPLEALEQKVQLLKSLLCIGALPEALYILGRFPWIMGTYQDMPDYIHRILHHSLKQVYEYTRPLQDRPSLRAVRRSADVDQAGMPKGQIRLSEPPTRKVLRWPLPDKEDPGEQTDFRFYWDDWADNIPVCQSVDDVFTLCNTLLNLTGVKIGRDASLLLKLARIGKQSVQDDSSKENIGRWIDLSKRLLVPALSLTKSNPGVVNEVFELIKTFPTSTRYSIYAEWYSGPTSRLPDIKAAFDQARAETKDVLKRISKTNVKLMARALAKVAYASPGVVFSVAINQIEAYDNLVEVVVECARYFTLLGYDVLTWSLMSSLGGKGRNRVQADGMLTSRWLAALALFAGRVFKRYSSLMSPTPIMQYVADQLQKNNTTDLIVLKEITSSMGGVISDTNFNDSQTLAMAGGDLLRQQTLLQLHDRRHDSKTTSKRLIRSLTEPKLAGKLLILIAQERQTSIFSLPEPDAHIKLLGNLFDEIHRVLAQYLDLLRSNLSVLEFDESVPDVVELITQFGIDTNIAFWICRESISASLTKTIMTEPAVKSASPTKEAETQVQDQEMKDETEEGEHEENQEVQKTNDEPKETVVELANADKAVDEVSHAAGISVALPAPEVETGESWHPPLRNLMERIKPTLPEEVWSNLSVSFYVTFWQLSLYDIQVPSKSYEEEIGRLKTKWISVRDDRSDMSIAGSQRKEKEKAQLTDLQDKLRDELKSHIQTFTQTKGRLLKEKNRWFEAFWGKWDAVNDALIQYCLLPRLLLSSTDALFCFKMIRLLHSTGAANFRTMGLIDHIFRESRIANMIFTCTTREAENLGRFLNEILRDLAGWHSDKALYEKEAYGPKRDLPGFALKVSKDKAPESFLDFEDFRRILYKWHKNINSALKSCLTGGEHMHIRNAIIVLKSIHEHFPAVNWIGRDQVNSVTELSKNEKREDLKIATTSLLGNLKKREKKWVLPQAFNLIENAQVSSLAGRGGTRSATPQIEDGKAKQAPAAGETATASPQPSVEKDELASNAMRLDAEDGEIDDTRSKQTATDATDDATSGDAEAGSATEVKSDEAQDKEKRSKATDPDTELPSQDVVGIDADKDKAQEDVSMSDNQTETQQHDGSQSVGSARPPHGLPTRPELPSSRSHGRRGPENGRDQRNNAGFRGDRSRDQGQSYRSTPTQNPRDQDRALNRPTRAAERPMPQRTLPLDHPDRHLYENPPPDRLATSGPRSLRGRGRPSEMPNGVRQPDQIRSRSRDSAPAPPKADIMTHPDRAPLVEAEPPRGPNSSRSDHGTGRGRLSRASSPGAAASQDGVANGRPEPRREERPRLGDRIHSADRMGPPSNRPDDRPPSGPRNERGLRRGAYDPPPETGHPGDLFNSRENQSPRFPAGDYENADQRNPSGSRFPDPNYGRLNADPNISAGPPRRNASMRGGRGAPSGHHQAGARGLENNSMVPQGPLPPSAPRQPPLSPSARGGPADLRRGRRASGDGPQGYQDQQQPAEESSSADLAGVHPDRLRGIQAKGPGQAMPPPSPQTQSEPGHGRRRSQTSSSSGAPPDSRSNMPPVSPIAPPPLNARVPNGPASAGDRNRDKRFVGLQNVLQSGTAGGGPTEKPERGIGGRRRNSRGGSSAGHPGQSPGQFSGPPTPTSRGPLQNDQPPLPLPPSRTRSFEGERDMDLTRRQSGQRRSPPPPMPPAYRDQDERYAVHEAIPPGHGSGRGGARDKRHGMDPREDLEGRGREHRDHRERERGKERDGARERDGPRERERESSSRRDGSSRKRGRPGDDSMVADVRGDVRGGGMGGGRGGGSHDKRPRRDR